MMATVWDAFSDPVSEPAKARPAQAAAGATDPEWDSFSDPEAGPPPVQTAPGAIGSQAPAASAGTPGFSFAPADASLDDAISGASRREFDLPSFAGIGGAQSPADNQVLGGMRTAMGAAFADDEGFANVIREQYGDAASFWQDKFGNVGVTIDGQEFYANRPGLDSGDALRLLPNITGGIGIGRGVGQMVGRALPRAVAVGAGEAGLQATSELKAGQSGSGQDFNWGNVAAAGALGVAGEGLVTGVGRALRGPAPRVARSPTPVAAAQASRIRDASGLPTPVPMSRADITRVPDDSLAEQAISQGREGQVPAAMVNDFRASQREALRANVDQMGEGLYGKTGRGQAPRGGAAASTALTGRAARDMEAIDSAYAAARETGGAALVNTTPGEAVAKEIVDSVEDFLPFAPKAKSLADEIKRKLSPVADDAAEGAGDGVDDILGALDAGDGPTQETANVKSIFDWRRKASELRSSSNDPTEQKAIGRMMRVFDGHMMDAAEKQLFTGDQAAVGKWLTANRLRADFAAMYEGDDLVARLVSTERRGGVNQLVVPPEEVANEIFGRAGLKLGDRNLVRDLTRMKGLLNTGGNTQAWDGLREEAFLRLFRSSEGGYDGSTVERSFSGSKLAASIDRAFKSTPDLMKVLFSADEIMQLHRLKRVSIAATTTAAGGTNTSGTAAALIQSLSSRFMGGTARTALSLLDKSPFIGGLADYSKIRNTAARLPQPGAVAPAGIIGKPPKPSVMPTGLAGYGGVLSQLPVQDLE